MTFMTDSQWNVIVERHELAYFCADVCLGSPESFSLDEKREICETMAESTAEVDAAMKNDFRSWSPTAQARMLDLLQQADPCHFDWWLSLLVDEIPDSVSDLQAS